jgi:hypothetical protein
VPFVTDIGRILGRPGTPGERNRIQGPASIELMDFSKAAEPGFFDTADRSCDLLLLQEGVR